ncbi:hypothetical protein, conserved [Eimeria brunetti]|uniref:Vacuolar protein 14 C-terminal Fig4-binding domain-containing protein n=1 Tax=Eimeria brunetti TaxID=51314 RepID=U6LDU1_9EIME|nr:hypothetical protein, conserved [Eimeria brunetti]
MYGSSAEFPTAGPLFGKETCRGLADKSFEKRKTAAHALQQLIKQQVLEAANAEAAPEAATDTTAHTPSPRQQQQEQQQQQQATQATVQKAVSALTADFLSSPIASIRKGGLLGVAAVGLAFESGGLESCLLLLLRPLLKSFGDPDPRVRYYACESLFNVLKAARGHCLQFLPELFDGLCKLCGDVDREVRQGVGFVDSLLKEETAAAAAAAAEATAAAAASAGAAGVPVAAAKAAVAAKGPITPAFIHLLVERLLVRNPYIKILALSWISLLESNTGVDMLQYLPLFLGGLLQLLGDSHRDIRQAADLCVTNFLEDLRSDPVDTDPAVVTQTAEVVLRCSDSSNSSFTQLTALVWLHELLLLLLPDEGQQQRRQQQQQEDFLLPQTPIVRWHLEVQKHLKVLVSTAALDLSDFVSSAAEYLRTYTPPGPTAAAAADNSGAAASTATGDVRSLCIQWMELMLVEKPHLLLVGSEEDQQQQQQQENQAQNGMKLSKRFLKMHQRSSDLNDDETQNLLLQKQQPLVAAVLYTALTADGAAAAAAAPAQETPSRQQSATTPTDGSGSGAAEGATAAATAAPSNHLLRMSLSVLSRFVQRSDANLRVVSEELLALFNSNRCLLDSRGHFVLRQLCTMRNPCEVFLHMAKQIDRLCTAATGAGQTPAVGGASAAASKAQGSRATAAATQQKSPRSGGEESQARQPRTPNNTAEQTLQFLHQTVQALSIDLLSAKEAEAIRQELRKDDNKMFEALLPTWVHNPVWLIALSLYGGKYEVAAELVKMLLCFHDLSVSFSGRSSSEDSLSDLDMLQLEQLVLLLESKPFALLRMQLLQQPVDPHLITAIRGLGMLLPQGPAFSLLYRRLQLASPSGCCCTSQSRANKEASPIQTETLVSRALSLAGAARKRFKGELSSVELPMAALSSSSVDCSRRSVGKTVNSPAMSLASVEKLQKISSIESLEAALDEALTEHGSILKAFPSRDSDA